MIEPTVSILAEIPDPLHETLSMFLQSHPRWDYHKVMSAAIALFLLQNGSSATEQESQSYRKAARIYLDTTLGGICNA